MEFDLNQEPSDSHDDSVMGLGSLLNELETSHGHIEERMRQLEAVTFRAIQRQRWRRGNVTSQTVNISVLPSSENTGGLSVPALESTFENDKTGKGDGTNLVAKALAMDADIKEVGTKTGGFFDCNICKEMAREPILTCCGHLFCWPCFYQLPYVQLNAKECPECKGEVVDTGIIPIYGNGSGKGTLALNRQKVPPRPNAQRIESTRQQLINRGISSNMMNQRIQQLSNMSAALRDQSQVQDFNSLVIMSERANLDPDFPSQALPGADTGINQPRRPLHVSRLLLQGAASFSSLSSALDSAMDSAERLFQDLETYIYGRHVSRSNQHFPSVDDIDSFPSIPAAVQPVSQTFDTATGVNYTPQISIPPVRGTISIPIGVAPLENQFADYTGLVNTTVPPLASSSRRRTRVRRAMDANDGGSHRRRRF